jgi:hypothetical protein
MQEGEGSMDGSYSVEQSPLSEADCHSAVKEMSYLLFNRKFNCYAHKSPLLIQILSNEIQGTDFF